MANYDRSPSMRIKVKINPKTGVVYLPKSIVEDGFNGEVDVYGAGAVIVIPHPDADVTTIKESMSLVARDIELTPGTRPRRGAHLPKSQRIKQNGGDES
jgi:hypothetical protein